MNMCHFSIETKTRSPRDGNVFITMAVIVIGRRLSDSFISKISSAAHKIHYSQIHWHTLLWEESHSRWDAVPWTSKSVCGYFTVYFQPSVWISFNDLPVFKSNTTADCVPMCWTWIHWCLEDSSTRWQHDSRRQTLLQRRKLCTLKQKIESKVFFAIPCAAFTPQLPAFTLYIALR